MKEIITPANMENCIKKLTNHNGRRTHVNKMKAADVPETVISKVTGHKTSEGLKSYDPGDREEFRRMSNAIFSPPTKQQTKKRKYIV